MYNYKLKSKPRWPVGFQDFNYPLCHVPFYIDTYSGCSFGCFYCYTRQKGLMRQPTPLSFGEIHARLTRHKTYIDGSTKELPPNATAYERYRWGFDNATYKMGVRYDPFPGIETKYKNSYKVIELFAKWPGNHYLIIQTKNPSLITDEYLDIGANLAVAVSISTLDGRFEPHTPTVQMRLDALKRISLKIPVSLRLAPGISDWWSDDQIKYVLDLPIYVLVVSAPMNIRGYAPNYLSWDPCRERDWYEHLVDIAKAAGKRIHFQTAWAREQGCRHCLPDNFPDWKGTIYDDVPVLPEDVKLRRKKDGELVACNEKDLQEWRWKMDHMTLRIKKGGCDDILQ